MNKLFLSFSLFFIAISGTVEVLAQAPPPSRLKYFGFAFVDCGIDDPNDTVVNTNYTTEVDSFSNIAEMHFDHDTDNIISRVNLMNSHCMKPILSVSSVFVYLANSNGPSGSNYDLYPNYLARWNTFKTINASVLNSNQIEMIYVCDEPTWNGVTFGELDTICTTIHNDFPNIPLIFVEGWPTLSQLQIPATVTWVGFDHYGIENVSTDSTYLAWLDTLKSKRSTPAQKIMLVFDDEWNAGYWPSGWQPDTMEQVFEHYYDLALADTDVIGLAGFTWPGIAPGWLGARSLPQNVIDKTVQIGKMIKSNYDPCNLTAVEDALTSLSMTVNVYPNPSSEGKFHIHGSELKTGKVYDVFGRLVETVSLEEGILNLNEPAGIYFLELVNKNKTERIKLIVN